MKNFFVLLAVAVSSFFTLNSSAQGTGFTYQGRLNDGGNPATGIYDLRFTTYDSNNQPAGVVAGPITNSAVTVVSGLFTATLDFGANVFTGANRWLEIAVRRPGGAFATLSPRQPITPVPYAAFAMTPAGPQGVQGEEGTQGPIGLTGAKGDTGEKGDVGLTGAQGLQGGQGIQGPIGVTGSKGDKGDTGLAGAQGIQGEQGTQGSIGLAGATGPKGDKGDKGDSGVNGPIGPHGIQGPPGVTGAAGPKGDKGDQGASGVNGPAGPQGERGLQGPNGVIGPTGPSGAKGEKGEVGLTGPTGANGPVGPQGPVGPEGPLSPNVALRAGGNTFMDGQLFSGPINLDSEFGFRQSPQGYFAVDSPGVFGGRFAVSPDGRVGIGAIAPQQRLSVADGMNIDQNNANNGTFANVLSFGSGSGEAIGSKRDPGDNQYGLDFYTAFVNRLSIFNNGHVAIHGPATFSGDVSISYSSLHFGLQLSQMVNLWGSAYGIGVQSQTQYYRTGENFVWYKGGGHRDSFRNAGGGAELMWLDAGGNLSIAGAFGQLSDRNAKQDFEPINERDVLEKVVALPLVKWSFKADPSTRHIGPIAQDFYEAFNLGADDKHITTVDADGVALAAIQGLNKKLEEKLEEKNTRITELEERLSKLEQLITGGAK